MDELLATYADLTCVWHFKTNLLAIYGQCLAATDESPRYALTFMHVLSSIADGVHYSCPDEVTIF